MFSRIMVLSLIMLPFSMAAYSGEESVYTLYRDGYDYSKSDQDYRLRIHIATFDAVMMSTEDGNDAYNLAICGFAPQYFQKNQPWSYDGEDKFWCEKGRYKK